jgi:putative phosphoesterase
MRVAALYDIHGNLPALEAVLADVDKAGVDAIVCGGDVLGGPFSAEVFDRLTGVDNVSFVRGNADRFVLEGVDEFGQDWGAERRRLGNRRLAAVAAWPLSTDLEIQGLGRVLFCHAIPTSDEPIFTRITPDEAVVDLLGDVPTDVMVCGHTHVQFDRQIPTGLRIVNAGSVGMPYEGRRGAFWALLGPTVELRRTDYDLDAAVGSMRAARGEQDESMLGWLLEPPDPDEASAFFEAQRTASGA